MARLGARPGPPVVSKLRRGDLAGMAEILDFMETMVRRMMFYGSRERKRPDDENNPVICVPGSDFLL
jgi:hypothetical protein